MRLNTQDILEIKRHFRKHWITDEEFIAEMTDHFASVLEQIELPENTSESAFVDNKKTVFYQTLKKLHQDFGGTEKMLLLEKNFQFSQQKRFFWDYFQVFGAYFHFPKIFFLIALYIGFYGIFHFLVYSPIFSKMLLGISALFCVSMLIALIYTTWQYKKGNSTKRDLLWAVYNVHLQFYFQGNLWFTNYIIDAQQLIAVQTFLAVWFVLSNIITWEISKKYDEKCLT